MTVDFEARARTSSGCRRRPRRPSIGSCRRRSRTSPSTPGRPGSRFSSSARGRGRRGDRGRRRRLRPAAARDDALGLAGMRERVALVDGRLRSSRRPGRDDDRRRGAAVTIRVLVVDDHAVVRSGLRRSSTPRTTSRRSARPANARAGRLRGAGSSKPDVVLMDVVMPGESGIDALPECCSERRTRRCSCSRCRTTRGTSARRSPPARAATSSRRRRTRRSSARSARSPRGGRYVHPALGARLRRRRGGGARGAPTRIRCPSASARCCACSRSATRTRRSRSALHLRPHRGDAPGAHHAEAPPLDPRRARALRAGAGAAGVAAVARRRAARRTGPVDHTGRGGARTRDDQEVGVEIAGELEQRLGGVAVGGEAPCGDMAAQQRLACFVDEGAAAPRPGLGSPVTPTTATVEPYPARSATASSARREALEPS